MYDRFLILLDDGTQAYTTSFNVLASDICLEVIKHERTFDNGDTFIEVTQ